MGLDQVVSSRRSIRKYQDKKVNRSLIEKMIASAILAPSWKNSQTARYHIIDTKDMVSKFKEKCLPEFNATNCKDAPTLIVTSFIKQRSGYERSGDPTNELGDMWGAYDLGLHNQNLLLKATDLGLATLVMGIRDEAKIRELLQIDDNEIIVSIIAVGYADSKPEMPKRKDIKDIIKFY